jgi:hypothetical protein
MHLSPCRRILRALLPVEPQSAISSRSQSSGQQSGQHDWNGMPGKLGAIRNVRGLSMGRGDCKTAVDPGLFQNSIRKVVLGGEKGASAM